MNKAGIIGLLLVGGVLLAGCHQGEKDKDKKSEATEETSHQPKKAEHEDKKAEGSENKTESEKEQNVEQESEKQTENVEQREQQNKQEEKDSEDTAAQDDTAQFGRDDQRWKVKSPTQMPGDNPMTRKHVAMMMLNPKLNAKFLNAQDIVNQHYNSADGQAEPFANAMLVEGGYVPEVEDAPADMVWFLLAPSKVKDKTLVGVSAQEVVISTTSVSDEDAVLKREKIDYPAMIAAEGTQVFKVADLEKENSDSKAVDNVANKIYLVSPHTIQRVPTK